MSSDKTTEDILGYRVSMSAVSHLVSTVLESIGERRGSLWLACLNPHSYAVARTRTVFRDALLRADWLIPDGAGIVMASKVLGGRISARVTGSDVFYGVMDALNRRAGGGRVFFLGSTNEVLADIESRVASDWPSLTVAGAFSPPFQSTFGRSEILDMVNTVNASQADVLWVGMTAPKQEEWLAIASEHLDVPFSAAIGAVFDFYTGRVQRSHPMFQKFGLEWLPRLLQQPRRLWRRTFQSAPVFLWQLAKARMRRF